LQKNSDCSTSSPPAGSRRGGARREEGKKEERERERRERPFSSCLVPLGEKKARDKGLIESKGETGERRERGRREREEGEEREKATNGYFES
jgi:hypothetical protein